MKHLRWWAFLGMLFIGLVACSTEKDPTSQEIRIGVIGPYSGASSEAAGVYTREGASMAAAEINASGGLIVDGKAYTITLVFGDDQGTPEGGINAARQLITREKVVALVGAPLSSVAIPVGGLTEEQEIPLMSSISTNPQTTANRRYVFRVGFIDDVQGRAIANFAYNELEATTAAVIFDETNSYNRGLAQVFETTFTDLGGKIVASEGYPKDTTDFTQYLESIVAAQPDVLFMPNYTSDVILQAQQARTIGIQATFLGSDGWTSFRVAVVPELYGAFYSHHWHAGSTSEISQAFVERFRTRYGKEPAVASALTYDGMGLLMAAIQQQESFEPQAIRDGLAATRNYQGVTGSISYTNGGDPEKQVVIMQVQPDYVEFYEMVSP